MSVNQRDVEESLSPAVAVLTAEIAHTADLIGEDEPEATRGKLRSHLAKFYEAVAKELDAAETPQRYRVAEVAEAADAGGVYGGQRIIVGPLGGAGTPVHKGQVLGVVR